MITRYVNTASTAGGDGTTNATTGATRAYATLAEAETQLSGSAFADDVTILCSGATDDDSLAIFYGTYVQPGFTLYIRGNNTLGKYNDSAYVKKCDTTSTNACISFTTVGTVQHFSIIDMQCLQNRVNAVAIYQNATTTSVVNVENTLIKITNSSEYGSIWARSFSCVVNVSNSVIVDANGTARSRGVRIESSGKIINCAITGLIYGASVNTGVNITNGEVFNNTDDFLGTGTIDHCASDDGDGTNPISVSDWADEFYKADYLTDLDFRLKSTSVLLGAGVGPVLDANVPLTDIITYERDGDTATVGPFEYYWNYNPYVFPSDPYDGEEHRTVGSGSLYVYHIDRNVWMKANTVGKGITGLSLPGVVGVSPQGEIGAQGETGLQGNTGTEGYTGLTVNGETGPQGETGSPGITGAVAPDPTTDWSLTFYLDNGNSPLTTGVMGIVQLPYDVTIQSWEVLANETGSITTELKIGSYDSWPPSTVMNQGGTGPYLDLQIKNYDFDMKYRWETVTGAYGEYLQLEVLAVTGINSAAITLMSDVSSGDPLGMTGMLLYYPF